MRTVLLDTVLWDLVLDASGNIAVADEPYSIAQDVASAIKLFSGELFYNTDKGIPYFDRILGHFPSAAYISAEIVAAALTVPNVVSAIVTGLKLDNGILTGNVYVVNSNGVTQGVDF